MWPLVDSEFYGEPPPPLVINKNKKLCDKLYFDKRKLHRLFTKLSRNEIINYISKTDLANNIIFNAH